MSSGLLWVKALHIVMVTSWFAGLFYLPRLFVNLAMLDTQSPAAERARLLLMARKLYRFMGPLMLLTLLFGLWLWLGFGIGKSAGWMHAKLLAVLALMVYHIFCGTLLRDFEENRNQRGHVWYRWFNEAPVLLLFITVVLVVVKPF